MPLAFMAGATANDRAMMPISAPPVWINCAVCEIFSPNTSLSFTVKDKLVLGENISQTAQFIQTGGADIGIIALSLAVAPAMKASGMDWEIPVEAYPRLEQGAGILKAAKDQKTARAFLDYIKSPEGTAVFQR